MDLTTEAVRLGINMARVRAEVASVNIANVDVAGFRAQRADFGQALGLLSEAAAQPDMDAASLKAITPTMLHESVHDQSIQATGLDASAQPSLDNEVAELESANVDFQSLTTILSRRFALMQLAMAGRS